MSPDSHSEAIRNEFARTAAIFAERRSGEFDSLGVVEFSRLASGETVLEAGVGTGAFLSLFGNVSDYSVGVDMTGAMLQEAQRRYPDLLLVAGDGRRLPVRPRSFDLASTAQTLHHVPDPLPFLMELRRVVKDEGHVLVVDHVATERYEEALLMTKLEMIRDPSHAASRSPSVIRTLIKAAGLEIVDERIVELTSSFDLWMSPEEFPRDRIAEALDFIDRYGADTGLDFRREQGRLVFTTRRFLLLAHR